MRERRLVMRSLFYLAVFAALSQSPSEGVPGSGSDARRDETEGGRSEWGVSPKGLVMESVRSYPISPERTLAKLRLGVEYHLQGRFDPAEQLYQEVLWETRDSEEIAAVRELLTQLDEARSHQNTDHQGPPSGAGFSGTLAGPSEVGFAMRRPSLVLGPSSPARGTERPSDTVPARADESLQTLSTSGGPSSNNLAAASKPLLAWLESSVPAFIEVSSRRLARTLGVMETKEMTRVYSQEEIRFLIVQAVDARFPGQFQDIFVQIRPDGVLSGGTLHLGFMPLQITSKVGVIFVDENPQMVIHEARVGGLQVPSAVLKLLERRINRRVGQENLPLKLKSLDLREGSAVLGLELV